jgi:FkbM family methyltransferase
VFRDVRPGDLALDCGAHTGRITEVLAARGAEVIAFEPNPDAYAVLSERFAGHPRVRCVQAAVATTEGRAPLYLHARAAESPVARATGSSLLQDKGNVDPETWVEVETVDLDAFVRGLDGDVALLKLDVEGMELPVLRRLAETGTIDRIRHLLVEMHDRAAGGGLTSEGAAVRALLEDRPNVHLDWD